MASVITNLEKPVSLVAICLTFYLFKKYIILIGSAQFFRFSDGRGIQFQYFVFAVGLIYDFCLSDPNKILIPSLFPFFEHF